MSRKMILYVEDEQWMMEGVADRLSTNYEIVKARNVEQALDILKSNVLKIELILLDIMMPEGKEKYTSNRGRTSGVEFAKIVLEEMKLDIPIVCYTVVLNSILHKLLHDIGVKEIVSKKKLPSELEKVIEKHLK